MGNEQALQSLAASLAAEISPAELAAVIAEARAAAIDELRARLKEALLAELLDRAQRGPHHAAVRSPAPAAQERGTGGEGKVGAPEQRAALSPGGAEGSDAEATITADLDHAALAAELAALRAQLSANRAFLAGEPEPRQHAERQAVTPDDRLRQAQPAPSWPERGLSLPALSPPNAAEATPHAPRPTSALLYVYGIMPDGVALPAIAGVAAGTTLHALPCGDLCAVVSPVPAEEFGEAALEERMRDPVWLERAARAHEAAQRELMRREALVPLRFATIYTGPERVAAMVAERAEELRAALRQLAGRSEWGVKLWADPHALAAGVGQASPAVAELQAQIAEKPAGAAYMLQRRLERLAAEEAERLAQSCVTIGHARLCEHAAAAVCGPLREGGPARMLLNGSYLVDTRHQADFLAELDRLAAEHAPLGLRYELAGPWPGYHFC